MTELMLDILDVLDLVLEFLRRTHVAQMASCSMGCRNRIFSICAPLYKWKYSSMPLLIKAMHYNQVQKLDIQYMDDFKRCGYTMPQRIKQLTFMNSFFRPLIGDDFPPSLSKITYNCDQPLRPGVLPPNLLVIEFGPYFNQPLPPGVFPPTLEKIEFGDKYNQPLRMDVLPCSLLSLKFDRWFNHSLQVGVLPSSLETLVFGSNFNMHLQPGVLPPNLTSLHFGHHFNTSIQMGVLPSSLIELVFKYWFNQPLAVGVLPASLSVLSFGMGFDQMLPNGVLPVGLTKLTIGSSKSDKRPYGFPSGLLKLMCQGCFASDMIKFKGRLPSTLTELTLEFSFNEPLQPGFLPTGLKKLCFGRDFNQFLFPGVLPSGLVELHLGGGFGRSFSFPSSLRILFLAKQFYQDACKTFEEPFGPHEVTPHLADAASPFVRIVRFLQNKDENVILKRYRNSEYGSWPVVNFKQRERGLWKMNSVMQS